MTKLYVLALTVLLTACGKNPAIAIPQDMQSLFGVWQYSSAELDNDITTDKMLLIFHKDSSVSYKRCITRLNSHSYTTLPSMKLVALTNKKLILAQDIFITDWKKEFKISRLPYVEEGVWYFKVGELTLRKLKPGENSDHATWKCSRDEQKKQSDREISF